jgi:UDP-N-acetylmuramate--alanine ligase
MTDTGSHIDPHIDPHIDLANMQAIHLVGAGGSGMNAIGVVLAEMGHRVSGSDLKDSSGIARLRALGADISIGHDSGNLPAVDILARSTAVPDTNPEVERAAAASIPVLRRADILSAICGQKRTIAVAGTHGKTTTSSMLSLALVGAEFHPSFIIGGDLNEIGSGAVWDRDGELFVVEADESDGTFLELGAEAVVITNIEADHLDYYGTYAAIEDAFERFATAAPGPRVLCADDEGAAWLAAKLAATPEGCTTYGTSPDADYRIVDVVSERYGATFTIEANGLQLRCELPVPGLHNVLNATAAFATAVELGADPQLALEALQRFAGVARRFEFRGERDGVVFVDDYAHLPTEVAAAVGAARSGDWGRVVAVFQPHRYSRTAELWQDFADAFVDADHVVLTDVYAAGEAPRPGITGELLLRSVLDAHPWASVAYLPGRAELRDYLGARLQAGDLCLTLGAGDLTSLPDELLQSEATGDTGSENTGSENTGSAISASVA